MNVVANIAPPEQPIIGNVEAEASLLGGLMLANNLIDQVADELAAADFSEPLMGRIFAAIVRERSLGKPADSVTLRPYFAGDAAMAELGGPGYLAQLTGSGASIVGVRGFAKQIRELAQRRNLIETMQTAIASAEDFETPLVDISATVDLALSGLADEDDRGAKESTAAEALGNVLKSIEAGLPAGVASGIESLDECMGPLRPGNLQIIAARPGMGKTILGLTIARGAAEQGHGVLFVSLEMTEEQLAMRLAADLCFDGHSGIHFSHIERGDLSGDQFRRVGRVRDEIRDLPLVIADLASIRVGRLNTLIRRHVRRFAARGIKLELVVVDYLQLLDPDRASDNRTAEVTQISRALKMAAKANEVPVLALAQLSRKVEEREEKRPRLADLRESGSIEQDADGVLFLYRPEYYLLQTEPPEGHDRRDKWEASMAACQGDIEFICAKRRQGQTGIRHGRFYGAFQTVRG